MRRQYRLLLLMLAAIASWTSAYATGRALAQEGEMRPAIERCRAFCGRIYGENNDEYQECAVACDDADACHSSCKDKFGDDRPKVQKCLRACMRRGTEPPHKADEKPVPL